MRTYPHGVPCWIDTEQPDPVAAAQFYAGLFGWELTEAMPPGAPGTYLIATLDGQDVGGLTSSGAGPARWNTYVAVDDMDAAAAAFTAAGGTLEVHEPAPPGRSAVGADPTGAAIRLWQPGRRPGSQVSNVPGSWNFSDLHTPEPERARDFWSEAFGWQVDEPGASGWTMIRVPGYGDHLAATVDPGIRERQAAAPEGFADAVGALVRDDRAWWEVVLTVADRDRSAERAESLGATVVSTEERAWTRQAVISDPQGARLVLSQFTPPDGW